MKSFSTGCLIVGALCLAGQSQASILFSEAFDYAPGALGGAVNPGGGTWTGGNSGLTVVGGNLTYAGLADQGGNELQIANGSAGSIYNLFANQTSGQIFYSFLFNATATNSGNNYFTAMNPGTAAPNGGSDAIDAYYYANGQIRVRGNAQSAQAGTGPVLNLGQTYLIVEMIDLDAHTASLWVNPDASSFGGSAPTATATLTGLTATAIDDVGFKAQSAAGGPFLVDNLLIGTTWGDVTPAAVPEPSSLALGGLSLLSLLLARRDRK